MGLPTVVFNRTVRICSHDSDKAVHEVSLSFSTKYAGVLDKGVFYKLPGFCDAAQVRRLVLDVENGGGEVQLKVFKTKACNFKKAMRDLRKAGWR